MALGWWGTGCRFVTREDPSVKTSGVHHFHYVLLMNNHTWRTEKLLTFRFPGGVSSPAHYYKALKTEVERWR